MNIGTARKLAEEFRQVSRLWYERKGMPKMFHNGICFAVMILRDKNGSADDDEYECPSYPQVQYILNNVMPTKVCFLQPGRFSDERAMMCLFMAEWIETDLIPSLQKASKGSTQ
jgi:hypothetical protein